MSESSAGEVPHAQVEEDFRRIAGALVQAVRRELTVQNSDGSGSSRESQSASSNTDAGPLTAVSSPSTVYERALSLQNVIRQRTIANSAGLREFGIPKQSKRGSTVTNRERSSADESSRAKVSVYQRDIICLPHSILNAGKREDGSIQIASSKTSRDGAVWEG